jgi:DNA-binding NtrC family response regulator
LSEAGGGELHGRVLVVDDEPAQRDILRTILEAEGYAAATAGNGVQALVALREGSFDLVLTDLKMPGMSGIVLLEGIQQAAPGICVILMTAHGSIGTAVDAMKKGAFDYLSKPLDRDQLLIVLRRAMERVRLLRENRLLHEQLRERFSAENIVGESGSMQDVLRVLQKAAPSSASVLVLGEAGSGKELVARAIHYGSESAARAFHAIQVSARPEALVESELFGHERGAFPGAEETRVGLIEQATGSTLFVEDVADLPRGAQGRLLELLLERRIHRVGGTEAVGVDVRLIAATRHDLERAVREGRFREDLYYRLSVIPIVVPPLRQRRTDIPQLVEHFVRKHAEPERHRAVSDQALRLLVAYDWPGNVRELESVIERALRLSGNETIAPDDLPAAVRAGIAAPRGGLAIDVPDEGLDLEAIERSLVLRAHEKAGGNHARAARLLGLSRHAFEERLERLKGAPLPTAADTE